MTYLKHGGGHGGPKKKKKAAADKPVELPDELRDVEEKTAKDAAFFGNEYRLKPDRSSCVEEALDHLSSIVSTYVTRERDGENAQPLYSHPSGHPVRVQLMTDDNEDCTLWLECEALDRMAAAFERIADAMTARAKSV